MLTAQERHLINDAYQQSRRAAKRLEEIVIRAGDPDSLAVKQAAMLFLNGSFALGEIVARFKQIPMSAAEESAGSSCS